MGPRIPKGTRLWLGGLAAGGMAVAHLVSFVLVAPDPVRRQQLLESTGHGAWPVIVSLALGAFVVGLAALAVRAPPSQGWRSRGPLVGRLLLLQVVGFLLLEGLERLAVGEGVAGLRGLPSEPVILIGLVAQIVSALVAVTVLVFLDRVIVALIEFHHPRRRAPRTLALPASNDRHHPLPVFAIGPANPRGPPRRI